MLASQNIRVGVLRGGPSPEYAISLETGKSVLNHLPLEHYTPVDIFISRDGVWHEAGFPKNPESVLKKVDVVFNALHGRYGEDGEVAKLLELFNTPYTGSKPLSSALTMNKILSKNVYKTIGLKTPFSVTVPLSSLSRKTLWDVYMAMPGPYVVKPATAGSSMGVRIVHTRPELEEAILAAFEYSPQVLVEEFIKGKEVFAGVVNNFRGESLYSLLPFSTNTLSQEEKRNIEMYAKEAHSHLGLTHYSSSDFIIHPKRGIFILETDVLPPLTEKSGFVTSLSSVGSKLSDFLHHVVQSAIEKK